MNNPQVGQRWMVDTDSSLGLGIVTQCDTRTLTIDFPAVEESRCYSINNSPLTRVVFAVGDTIKTIDHQQYTVAQVETVNDLMIYLNEAGEPIPETRLGSSVELNHPVKRLLAAQLDKPKWFDLRADLTKAYHQWIQSDVVGLQGARITLTPHQLYVADTATRMSPTRVLLADEVGLGKTIEAGLILQRLLLLERVQRVLIIVPDSLRVQWFVELVRCFNIHAVMWGEEVDLDDVRVFIAAHTTLNHDDVLTDNPWDMVIVDEAHHFDLLDQSTSSDTLKAIGNSREHLLLLSATPERMGLEQHFSRLQLLDASRFHDFKSFQQQYDHYETLADDLALLLEQPQAIEADKNNIELHVPAALQEKLLTTFPQLGNINEYSHDELTSLLLDCHGTGRVVFRNTRSAIKGFPERCLTVHDLSGNDADADQRLLWLSAFVKQHAQEKILLITHHKEDVLDIREWLYRKTGIDCPVFHEDMSLIERDRAAAYFADQIDGAPMLLCSEIGSEGRNFQFCGHLICWDLPEHPDVLEQRIGRLDRIGQQQTINIHVCVNDNDSQQRLHWYHHILNCIEKTNPAAGAMHDQWYQQYNIEPDTIGEKVRKNILVLLEQLQNGRDRLLEINSCRQPQANQLVDKVLAFEHQQSPKQLLSAAADLLNIHFEPLDEQRFSIIPSDQMLVPFIPGIPEEGCEITFDRDTATAREDVQFMTWDHPLMQGINELISTSELGLATVALLPNKALKPGTLFFEVLYDVSTKSPYAKLAQRFITQSLLRIVLTSNNAQNLHEVLPQKALSKVIEHADKNIRKAVIKDYQKTIQSLAEKANHMAEQELQEVIKLSRLACQQYQHVEMVRLKQLQERNTAITAEDVEQQLTVFAAIENAITEATTVSIQAVRVLVTYQPEK